MAKPDVLDCMPAVCPICEHKFMMALMCFGAWRQKEYIRIPKVALSEYDKIKKQVVSLRSKII